MRTVRIMTITVSTNRHVSTDSKATNRISVSEKPVAATAAEAKGVVDAVVNSRVVVGALVVVVVVDVEVLMVVGGVVVVVGSGVVVVGRGVVVAGGGGDVALKCCK